MIKQLIIHNFQSHADTVLDLDLGVNLITGQSDSGKTAIIRALKWLATNRPLGDGFRSWDNKDATSVSVILDDESLLTHRPSKYILTKNLEVSEWNAVGTGVPETVQQTLNISDLSWQSQMDPPFLLSDSPGEVARTLNEVADLDKIDSTLVNINRMARDNRVQLTEIARAKQQLEIDLSAFRELDNQLAKISQLKEMERKAGLLEDMVVEGDRLTIQITDQEKELAQYECVDRQLVFVSQLNKKMADYDDVSEGIGKGQQMLAEIREMNDRLKAIKDPTDAEAELDLLLDMVGQEKGLDSDISRLKDQLSTIQNIKIELKESVTSLTRLEKQWHDQFPEICPLCGRGKNETNNK